MSYKCSKCGQNGHNVRSCKLPDVPKLVVVQDDNGDFIPGQTSNPGGAPTAAKQLSQYIRGQLERRTAHIVVDELINIMIDGNNAERIHAAKLLLEYGYGKPRIQAEITGANGGPIEIAQVRHELASAIDSISARLTEGEDTGEHH